MVQSEDWQDKFGHDIKNPTSVKSKYLDIFKDWDPHLQAFIESMDANEDTNLVARSLSMLPLGSKWNNKPGITLIGDAAHLMTPFAGEGVNMAMNDALDLADALIGASKNNFKDVVKQIDQFERLMGKRMMRVEKVTHKMMSAMYFTAGAPYTSIERYISTAVTDEMNPVLAYSVTSLIYVFYFFWKHFGFGKNLAKSLLD